MKKRTEGPVTKGIRYEATVVPLFDKLAVDGAIRLTIADAPSAAWFHYRAKLNGFVVSRHAIDGECVIIRLK